MYEGPSLSSRAVAVTSFMFDAGITARPAWSWYRTRPSCATSAQLLAAAMVPRERADMAEATAAPSCRLAARSCMVSGSRAGDSNGVVSSAVDGGAGSATARPRAAAGEAAAGASAPDRSAPGIVSATVSQTTGRARRARVGPNLSTPARGHARRARQGRLREGGSTDMRRGT